tara:strand:- start:1332 stop:2099 length:768 start_codon:yes stop_codon:yes gene_type:complete
MKHLDIMEQGGYPFDDISINYLQQMHNERDSFIQAVFGDNKIVKGAVLNTQSNIFSDGLISVGGKLYHFVGGAPQAKISKKKIETKRQYEDGNQKKAFINEFYEFGENGTDAVDFSDLKRWYPNQPITKEIKYVGSTVTNATLPEGWFIADGANGTDDLRSKFVVGFDSRDADYNAVGEIGGSKKHNLTEQEMPSHKHGMENGAGGDDGAGRVVAGSDYGIQDLSKAFTKQTGGSQPHENRPPYYTMQIIQFVGV